MPPRRSGVAGCLDTVAMRQCQTRSVEHECGRHRAVYRPDPMAGHLKLRRWRRATPSGWPSRSIRHLPPMRQTWLATLEKAAADADGFARQSLCPAMKLSCCYLQVRRPRTSKLQFPSNIDLSGHIPMTSLGVSTPKDVRKARSSSERFEHQSSKLK